MCRILAHYWWGPLDNIIQTVGQIGRGEVLKRGVLDLKLLIEVAPKYTDLTTAVDGDNEDLMDFALEVIQRDKVI